MIGRVSMLARLFAAGAVSRAGHSRVANFGFTLVAVQGLAQQLDVASKGDAYSGTASRCNMIDDELVKARSGMGYRKERQ